jgi:hypothetical protein
MGKKHEPSTVALHGERVMPYRIMYSRLGVVRDAGPFTNRQDAVKEACRLRRVMPGYVLEIWSGDERIMDHAALKKLCDR